MEDMMMMMMRGGENVDKVFYSGNGINRVRERRESHDS